MTAWTSNPDWRALPSLVADVPRRSSIGSAGSDAVPCRILVFRNEIVEPTLALAARMSAHWGIRAEWVVGAYDDTFRFPVESRGDEVLAVMWCDWRRLPDIDERWVKETLVHLRAQTDAPIVIVPPFHDDDRSEVTAWLQRCSAILPAIDVMEADELQVERQRDPARLERYGSDLTPEISAVVGRELGVRWLPAVATPPVKCVVIDLDNTLYDGVVGEDGAEALVVGEQHRALGAVLRAARARGIVLAVASKNDPRDVDKLWEQRDDLPLGPSDFVAIEASWDEKADAIARIAQSLNFGEDACAFVDDNPAELIQVDARGSGVWTIQADTQGTAVKALARVGRLRGGDASDAAQREADLRANRERGALLHGETDFLALHRQLATRIEVAATGAVAVWRAAELAGKTNQFNLSLGRTGEAELARGVDAATHTCATITVSDSAADSGAVAAVILRTDDEVPLVKEFLVSCRVLGRGLESVLLLRALDALDASAGSVRIEWVTGPRNAPALAWLSGILGVTLEQERGICSIDVDHLRREHRDLYTLVTEEIAS